MKTEQAFEAEKKPSDMSRDELLVKVGKMMAGLRRLGKENKELKVKVEFLESQRDKVNLHNVLIGTKHTKPPTLKSFTKGMPKELRKLNGYLK
jgi:hypothetical protein